MAQVARSYGRSVSWGEVRSNANLRREICRWIGHDNRLTEVCGGWFGYGDSAPGSGGPSSGK
jgi:hypothetical protein